MERQEEDDIDIERRPHQGMKSCGALERSAPEPSPLPCSSPRHGDEECAIPASSEPHFASTSPERHLRLARRKQIHSPRFRHNYNPAEQTDRSVSDNEKATESQPENSASTPDGGGQQQENELVNPIPLEHICCILAAFGNHKPPHARRLDLYRHVLKVEPTASNRQLRCAYLRRGQDVLKGITPGVELSEEDKRTFKAISMAYYIVCNPAWKNVYESCDRNLFRILLLPYVYQPVGEDCLSQVR